MQRAEVLAARERGVRLDGLGAGLFQTREDECVDLRVALAMRAAWASKSSIALTSRWWIACAIHVADALTSCSDMGRR